MTQPSVHNESLLFTVCSSDASKPQATELGKYAHAAFRGTVCPERDRQLAFMTKISRSAKTSRPPPDGGLRYRS